MNERFIIGTTEFAGVHQYYIFDKETKETLYYPVIDSNGKYKNKKAIENEISDYCKLLNKQNSEGVFCDQNVKITKKEAEFIAKKLNARLQLCQSCLEIAEKENQKHQIISFRDEIDTINSIVCKLAPLRFPVSVLKNKNQQ